jgi:hypothetical protein
MSFRAAAIVVLMFAGAMAHAASPARSPWRVAESGNACLINCASQNDSCKRMCPTSYSGPCLSACDNQAQFCQQSCRGK